MRLISTDTLQLGRHAIEVRSAPEHAPPFPVEAVILEEDTHLTLSATAQLRSAEQDHPVRIMTEMHAFQPAPPGSILVTAASAAAGPLRIRAVVRDLDRDPDSQPDWVVSALDATWALIRDRRLRSIGLHALGTRYGSGSLQAFLELLETTLDRSESPHPQRIWLMTSSAGAPLRFNT